jgi:predicted MPP superfamily phosphohydrolase
MSRGFDATNNILRARVQMAIMASWSKMGRDRYHSSQFEIVSLTVPIPGLDQAFDGYRIVQITDIHMGHWITASRLEGVVALTNQQAPDLVVLTGDFVSYVVDEIADDLAIGLSRLQAADGVLAILGNHDHWMGADRISQILIQGGVHVLRNEIFACARTADPPKFVAHSLDSHLYIAGLDDILVCKHDLGKVLANLPDDGPVILLAHEPDYADTAAAAGRFALQLSGHSHGGQIVIPGFGPILRGPMFWKYPLGRYQVGDMVLYTNRGIGTHVLRLRINCPPEITVIVLKSKEVP